MMMLLLLSIYCRSMLSGYLRLSSDCLLPQSYHCHQIVGTDLGARSISLFDVPRTVPTVLVLGNEGHGIRTNILRRCTHLVRIGGGGNSGAASVSNEVAHESVDAVDSFSTESGGEELIGDLLSGGTAAGHEDAVDSLNVSVTGAIILHHFLSPA